MQKPNKNNIIQELWEQKQMKEIEKTISEFCGNDPYLTIMAYKYIYKKLKQK